MAKNSKSLGYYESKTNKQNYFVNNNTVKYKIINEQSGVLIYPKNEAEVINKIKNEDNKNIFNRYEQDKETYIKSKKESVTSGIIFAGIILAISLVEIYLMMRSSFLSRIKEVGILRAIGVKKTDIYKMFVGEILAITSTASLLGILFMSYMLSCVTQIKYLGSMFVINFGVILLSIILVYAFNIIVGLLPLFGVLRKTPAAILSRHDLE